MLRRAVTVLCRPSEGSMFFPSSRSSMDCEESVRVDGLHVYWTRGGSTRVFTVTSSGDVSRPGVLAVATVTFELSQVPSVLVVATQTHVHMLSEDGQIDWSRPVAFKVRNLWPLPYGLLLEKDDPREGEPAWVSMMHPLDEFRPISSFHVPSTIFSPSFRHTDFSRTPSSPPINISPVLPPAGEHFPDPSSWRIVYSSTDHPLVVAHDGHAHCAFRLRRSEGPMSPRAVSPLGAEIQQHLEDSVVHPTSDLCLEHVWTEHESVSAANCAFVASMWNGEPLLIMFSETSLSVRAFSIEDSRLKNAFSIPGVRSVVPIRSQRGVGISQAHHFSSSSSVRHSMSGEIVDILVLRKDGNLVLYSGKQMLCRICLPSVLRTRTGKGNMQVVGASNAVRDRCTFKLSDGSNLRVCIPTGAASPLVESCLSVFAALLPGHLSRDIREDFTAWNSALQKEGPSHEESDWPTFARLILCIGKFCSTGKGKELLSKRKFPESPQPESSWEILKTWHARKTVMSVFTGEDFSSLPSIVMKRREPGDLMHFLPVITFALHLVYEECKLDVLSAAFCRPMAELLAELSAHSGLSAYFFHYKRDFPDLTAPSSLSLSNERTIGAETLVTELRSCLNIAYLPADVVTQPPSILEWINSKLSCAGTPAATNVSVGAWPYPVLKGGLRSPCEKSRLVCFFVELLCGDGTGSQLKYSAESVHGPRYVEATRRYSVDSVGGFGSTSRMSRGGASSAVQQHSLQGKGGRFWYPSVLLPPVSPSVPSLLSRSPFLSRSLTYAPESPLFVRKSMSPAQRLSLTMSRSVSFSRQVDVPYHTVALGMAAERFTFSLLGTLPFGVAWPFHECINRCRENPPVGWPNEAYELIGRHDLAWLNNPRKMLAKGVNRPDPRGEVSGDEMVASEVGEEKNDDGMGSVFSELSRMLFVRDSRLEETRRLLSGTCLYPIRSDGDVELQEELQNSIWNISQRVMSTSCGRALFVYRTRKYRPTEYLDVPSLMMAGKSQSSGAIVHLDSRSGSNQRPEDFNLWAEFHNGCAMGLSVREGSLKKISRTWIAYHSVPPDSSGGEENGVSETVRHARRGGILLAFGLQGFLSSLSRHDLYRLLSVRDERVTSAVLLGIPLSLPGSMDISVTRMLSMHIPALAPTLSDVDVPSAVCSAARLGIGILYMGTHHRFMSELLLGELGRAVSNAQSSNRVPHALSAGISLGLVNLSAGSADVESNLGSLNIIDRLVRFMDGGSLLPPTVLGDADPEPDVNLLVSEGDSVNLHVTGTAAMLALGLMFLQTDNASVGRLLALPDSRTGLRKCRPDMAMTRCICRAVVMWSDIVASVEWIHSMLPSCITSVEQKVDVPEDTEKMITRVTYMYGYAGCCFAIGLRYAGCGDEEVKKFLLEQLEFLGKSHLNLQRNVQDSCVASCAIALALVMAGSGDLSVMQVFRYLIISRSTEKSVSYSFLSALHMSLGLLFLSGGVASLRTTNVAVAGLLLSFYPVAYPRTPWDNATCPLQALRHLWVWAVEPRCVEVREADTGALCSLMSSVTMTDGSTRRLPLPGVLPPLSLFSMIDITSEEYYPISVSMDLHAHRSVIEAFVNEGDVICLYVLKRQTWKLENADVDSGILCEWKHRQVGELELALEQLTSTVNMLKHEDSHENHENTLKIVNLRLVRSCVRMMEREMPTSWSNEYLARVETILEKAETVLYPGLSDIRKHFTEGVSDDYLVGASSAYFGIPLTGLFKSIVCLLMKHRNRAGERLSIALSNALAGIMCGGVSNEISALVSSALLEETKREDRSR